MSIDAFNQRPSLLRANNNRKKSNMYKWINEAKLDDCRYEYVDESERCEDCGKKYKNCEYGDVIEDDDEDAPFDELNYRR